MKEGRLLLRTRFEPIVLAGFVLAYGATSAILWELGEYVTFIRTNEDDFDTAYTDTLGDLTLDLLGTLIAAAITYWLARRRDRLPYGSQAPRAGRDALRGRSTLRRRRCIDESADEGDRLAPADASVGGQRAPGPEVEGVAQRGSEKPSLRRAR